MTFEEARRKRWQELIKRHGVEALIAALDRPELEPVDLLDLRQQVRELTDKQWRAYIDVMAKLSGLPRLDVARLFERAP